MTVFVRVYYVLPFTFIITMRGGDMVDYSSDPLATVDIWVLPVVGGVVEVEAPPSTWVGGVYALVYSPVRSVEGFSPSDLLLSSPSPFQIPEFVPVLRKCFVSFGSHSK